MEKKKRGFLLHLFGAMVSGLSIILFFHYNNNILLMIGLCLAGFVFSLYLNSANGMGKGIFKTLLCLLILFVVLFAILYFAAPTGIEEYLVNIIVFSFLLLPSVSLIGKILSIFIDLLPLI